MWDSILDILEEKAAEGLDVRLIYDDMGCIMTLPRNYYKRMEKLGIRCCTFHRFQPVLTGTFNNRDHRKICVIDSEVAFTGGVNLADEYINRRERFGHWLDCGVMLRGEAVYSFTLMFLSMWDYIRHEEDDASRFLPRPGAFDGIEDDGFVQPYSDAPSDDEAVGETAYINMLSRAERYVYICTPYLVIDNELMNALTSAAKSGIDVRMITPGVPGQVVRPHGHAQLLCAAPAGRREGLRVHPRLHPLQDHGLRRRLRHLRHHQPRLPQPLPPPRVCRLDVRLLSYNGHEAELHRHALQMRRDNAGALPQPPLAHEAGPEPPARLCPAHGEYAERAAPTGRPFLRFKTPFWSRARRI